MIHNKQRGVYTLMTTLLASDKIHKLQTTFVYPNLTNLPLTPNKPLSPSDPDPMNFVVYPASYQFVRVLSVNYGRVCLGSTQKETE